jgi:hypothetical protein
MGNGLIIGNKKTGRQGWGWGGGRSVGGKTTTTTKNNERWTRIDLYPCTPAATPGLVGPPAQRLPPPGACACCAGCAAMGSGWWV